ncbi:hypothetical protein LINGRAHAP2_LOCUS31647 [Linum grandiflorum]
MAFGYGKAVAATAVMMIMMMSMLVISGEAAAASDISVKCNPKSVASNNDVAASIAKAILKMVNVRHVKQLKTSDRYHTSKTRDRVCNLFFTRRRLPFLPAWDCGSLSRQQELGRGV